MSRVGKKPILIPERVIVQIHDNRITVKGPKGELTKELRPEVKVEIKDGYIFITSKFDSKRVKAFWGLTRQIINNMVKGVIQGYEKKLEIEGVGYRAQLEGENLVLNVGFSHPLKIVKPEGIKFSVEKNIITVSGIDKELVGQIAANIRKVKKPDLYKGKGIKYLGEVIRKKLGKKAVVASGGGK